MLFLFVLLKRYSIMTCKQFFEAFEEFFASERFATMLRWFLFLTAILLFTLGGALATLILVTPAEVKKDEDDE